MGRAGKVAGWWHTEDGQAPGVPLAAGRLSLPYTCGCSGKRQVAASQPHVICPQIVVLVLIAGVLACRRTGSRLSESVGRLACCLPSSAMNSALARQRGPVA